MRLRRQSDEIEMQATQEFLGRCLRCGLEAFFGEAVLDEGINRMHTSFAGNLRLHGWLEGPVICLGVELYTGAVRPLGTGIDPKALAQ